MAITTRAPFSVLVPLNREVLRRGKGSEGKVRCDQRLEITVRNTLKSMSGSPPSRHAKREAAEPSP